MSAIDQYKHSHIGFIRCPSNYNFVNIDSSDKKVIALYFLEQDIPMNEPDFDGKNGDLLVGGGSGEVDALRISLPQAFFFFDETCDYDDFEDSSEIVKAFWSMNNAFAFGNGFQKLGWNYSEKIEFWIAEEALGFVLKKYPEYCKVYIDNNNYFLRKGLNCIGKDYS